MNIYKITVTPLYGAAAHPFSGYVAAEFIGAAIAKVRRLCADHHGFRPFRGNSSMNIVRIGVSNARHHPEAVVCALRTAVELGERDVVAAIRQMLKTPTPVTVEGVPALDKREVEARLAEAFGGDL